MVVAALLGYLGLVTGLLLNEASAVFVIANALRLLTWRSAAEPRALEGGESISTVTGKVPAVQAASASATGCCSSRGACRRCVHR